MRSQLVSNACKTVPNRYMLCHATLKALCKFHIPGRMIEETMNDVLDLFGKSKSAEGTETRRPCCRTPAPGSVTHTAGVVGGVGLQ
jgi:hypothetical protein